MFVGYIDPGTGMTIFGMGAGLIAFLFGSLGIFLAFFKRIFNFLKKHKWPILISIVLVLIICFRSSTIWPDKRSKKVINSHIIREIKLPEEIENISATKIRKQK